MSGATPGTLHLVPTPLDFGCAGTPLPLELCLPLESVRVAAQVPHWVCENAKSARAFLKRVDAVAPLARPLQQITFTELPRAAHKKGDHPGAGGHFDARPLLAPALAGQDIGLMSEAGLPAVADPGSSVVRAAHDLGLRVRAWPGTGALMLALAASGLGGQSFAFSGYVAHNGPERERRLRELDALALKQGQTQILIETPYRNAALLGALIAALSPNTRLAVAAGLTLPGEWVKSALVRDWRALRAQPWPALELPAVFLFGR
jgi:16S rRNA (cytidine1402-2'-O)-methyltransferase